ncbi:MAG: hypothetical protein ACPG5R_04715 [Cognaticolwellia aestuarii]
MQKQKSKWLLNLLSVMFLLAGVGIFYIDSTYSLSFYSGIINGGLYLAVILFFTIQIIKLKCYAVLSSKFSFIALLVLISALFFSMVSTLIGIKLAANTSDEVHQYELKIKDKYAAKLEQLLQQNNIDVNKELAQEKQKIELRYESDATSTLTLLEGSIKSADAEYQRQKNISNRLGNPVGYKLLEAKRRYNELVEQKTKFVSSNNNALQRELTKLRDSLITLNKTKVTQIKNEILFAQSQEVEHLKRNASLVYGIVNVTKLVFSALNDFLTSINCPQISQAQVDSLLGAMLIMLLEGGLFLVSKPYLTSLHKLSSTSAVELKNRAEEEQFKSNLANEYNKAMNQAFDEDGSLSRQTNGTNG